jgi:hypothetical protein
MQFAEMSKSRKNLGARNVSIHSEGPLLSVLNIGAAISQKSGSCSIKLLTFAVMISFAVCRCCGCLGG